jgi:uncharacterized membrane protein
LYYFIYKGTDKLNSWASWKMKNQSYVKIVVFTIALINLLFDLGFWTPYIIAVLCLYGSVDGLLHANQHVDKFISWRLMTGQGTSNRKLIRLIHISICCCIIVILIYFFALVINVT